MSVPAAPLGLTLAGLIPFAGLAGAVLLGLHPAGLAPSPALAAYGACILSFLGGARWGLALADRERLDAAEYAAATLPSLIGWGAILSPGISVQISLAVLAAGLAAMWAWDIRTVTARGAPAWYPRLRSLASAGAVASLALAAAASGSA